MSANNSYINRNKFAYDGLDRLKTSIYGEQNFSANSIDYLLGGNIICANGRFSKYLFGEGYIGTGTSANDIQKLSAYYFNKDHLGNIREVVDESGKVLQTNNYYPFGMPYTDNPNDNASLQKYKYNGKELDLVHGLNTYDYGARISAADVLGHEVGHTFGLSDNYMEGGIMASPPNKLSPYEVDEIWEKAYEK